MIEGGKVRVNARVVSKPSAAVGPGDVLTVVHGERVRVVRILGLPGRRGPATEAQAMYEESQERGVSSG
jgi:ribosome-associated heat shock protein Hsp15